MSILEAPMRHSGKYVEVSGAFLRGQGSLKGASWCLRGVTGAQEVLGGTCRIQAVSEGFR